MKPWKLPQQLLLQFILISTCHYVQGLSVTPPSFHVTEVAKVSATDFDVHKHYFHKRENNIIYETPVLVENALSQSSCEKICDCLVNNLGHIKVDVQRKRKSLDGDTDDNQTEGVQTKIYQCALHDALSLMMESSHDDSLFCFSEGLLDSAIDDEANYDPQELIEIEDIKQIITSTKEKLFGNDSKNHANANIFDSFPKDIRPSDCVIIAGEGATSTLHRDPFSWTGTSLCLEGTKIWRFIAPPGALATNDDSNCMNNEDSGVLIIDNTLNSYRLPSIAWGGNSKGDAVYLSSGWQSDYSLYSSFTNHKKYPSAEEFASMDEDEKYSIISDLSVNMEVLAPNCPKSFTTIGDVSKKVSIWSIVQKPGDLLIIPAHWWHQTYALEPSLAIASQRCGLERDCTRVLKHILDTSGYDDKIEYPPIVKEEYISSHSPTEIVDDLLELLSRQ